MQTAAEGLDVLCAKAIDNPSPLHSIGCGETGVEPSALEPRTRRAPDLFSATVESAPKPTTAPGKRPAKEMAKGAAGDEEAVQDPAKRGCGRPRKSDINSTTVCAGDGDDEDEEPSKGGKDARLSAAASTLLQQCVRSAESHTCRRGTNTQSPFFT